MKKKNIKMLGRDGRALGVMKGRQKHTSHNGGAPKTKGPAI